MFGWLRGRQAIMTEAWAQRVFSPAAQVVIARQDGRSVLLDLKHQRYWGLDETGTRIWEMVSARIPFGQIVDCLEVEYGASRDRLEEDAREFLNTLLATRLAVMS
ncbi:MAG: PqqD family protein [Longimicrobiales bacterium]